MVWWLAPSPHSERVPGSIPTWGLSVWVLSGYPGFLPPSKNMHVRLIDDSKIVLRSECEREWLFVLCGPVMDWRSVQGVPRLSPEDCWVRLQPTRDPTEGLSGRKWMDGFILLNKMWKDIGLISICSLCSIFSLHARSTV